MKKILIISAGFYEQYEEMLMEGATYALDKAKKKYKILKVPGCFEIPAALSMAIKNDSYSGFVTLGCVIRGQTSHYDHVCNEVVRGINKLAIDNNIAVGLGVITAENDEQAAARADIRQKDVGGRAAQACLAMQVIKSKMGV